QFRIEPRRGLRRLGEQNLDLLALRIGLVVALILVVTQRREVPHLVFELSDLVAKNQRRQQRVCSVDECAAQRAKGVNLAVKLSVGSLPGAPVRKDSGEIPLKAIGN